LGDDPANGDWRVNGVDDGDELDEVRTAAWTLIDVALPQSCLPGVRANLQILAGHAAVVRSALVDETTEAAEVFRA
jgi:Protein of unknown function (DUF4089)